MAGDSWQDLEFEVALDSGAVVHVCSLWKTIPGTRYMSLQGVGLARSF